MQTESQHPVNDSDLIPDLSKLPDSDKRKFVEGFVKITADAFLKVFVMLNLKDGIESGVINDATGDFFILSFKKQPANDLSAPAFPVEEKREEFQRWQSIDIDDAIRQVTEVMRAADVEFEKTGGGTRHYVSELLIPMLAEKGLVICKTQPFPPSPVIEIGERKGDIPEEEQERIYQEANDYLEIQKSLGLPAKDFIRVAGAYCAGKESEYLRIQTSHPAPAPIVGEKSPITSARMVDIANVVIDEALQKFTPLPYNFWNMDRVTYVTTRMGEKIMEILKTNV